MHARSSPASGTRCDDRAARAATARARACPPSSARRRARARTASVGAVELVTHDRVSGRLHMHADPVLLASQGLTPQASQERLTQLEVDRIAPFANDASCHALQWRKACQ